MIEIHNLTKTYRSNGYRAVDDLSMTVKAGEIFGFLGPNGAGKSTTIKCLTGIHGYETGTIRICGIDLRDSPMRAKQRIGFVPDDHVIYEGMTGFEYINFIANIFDVPLSEREARLEKYLKKFELEEKIYDKISGYSHGMKQKISIISALIHDPDLFILDEPMTGLDPQSAFQLKQIMTEYAANGKTVFFSSHILDVVEKLCTKVAIVNKGKVAKVIDLSENSGGQSLEELFLRVTGGTEGAG